MKKTLLLITLMTLGLFGCKKEYTYITNPDVGTQQQVSPTTGETTDVTDVMIAANTWTNVGEYAYNANNIRVWKYKSGNMIVIINNVPDELFWNKQFALGTTITGRELLSIKQKSQ